MRLIPTIHADHYLTYYGTLPKPSNIYLISISTDFLSEVSIQIFLYKKVPYKKSPLYKKIPYTKIIIRSPLQKKSVIKKVLEKCYKKLL